MRRSPVAWALACLGLIATVLWVVTLLPIADPLPGPLQGWRTVGSYFNRPPAYPGKPWAKDGRTVDSEELAAIGGPSHCDMQAVTILSIGWPPGTIATSGDLLRQYIRDPGQTVSFTHLLGSWARDPTLPEDAKDTGYRYGAVKLFLAPSDQDRYVYLVAPQDSERWPRSDPLTLCS